MAISSELNGIYEFEACELRVRIRSSRAIVEGLSAYLRLSDTPSQCPSHTLTVEVAPRLPDEMRGRMGYALVPSHQSRCYRIWTNESGAQLLSTEEDHLIERIDSREFRVIATDTWTAERTALRLIRSLTVNWLPSFGWVNLHSALIALNGSGILLVGPSGAGKTTLTTEMLRLPSTAFGSGDRVLVRATSGVIHAIPVPLALRCLPTTDAPIAGFVGAGLMARSKSESHDHKWELTPQEIAMLFKSETVGMVGVQHIVFLEQGANFGQPFYRSLDCQDAAIRMRNQYFDVPDPVFPSEWLGFVRPHTHERRSLHWNASAQYGVLKWSYAERRHVASILLSHLVPK